MGRFSEKNTYKDAKSGTATPKKVGPAVKSSPMYPNAGAKGGVFRQPKGGVKQNS
jgi:hypothetical protein